MYGKPEQYTGVQYYRRNEYVGFKTKAHNFIFNLW